jgi:hypothetical protein
MKIALAIPIILATLIFLPSLAKAADRTDEALTKIDVILEKAIDEVKILTIAATNIRTPAEAVVSLDRFSSIIDRMQNELRILGEEYAGSVNAKTVLGKTSEFSKRVQPVGKAYGQAIGRLPPAILNSDDFRSAFDKLRKLGLAQ